MSPVREEIQQKIYLLTNNLMFESHLNPVHIIAPPKCKCQLEISYVLSNCISSQLKRRIADSLEILVAHIMVQSLIQQQLALTEKDLFYPQLLGLYMLYTITSTPVQSLDNLQNMTFNNQLSKQHIYLDLLAPFTRFACRQMNFEEGSTALQSAGECLKSVFEQLFCLQNLGESKKSSFFQLLLNFFLENKFANSLALVSHVMQNNPQALFVLMLCKLRHGEIEEATKYFQDILDQFVDQEHYLDGPWRQLGSAAPTGYDLHKDYS